MSPSRGPYAAELGRWRRRLARERIELGAADRGTLRLIDRALAKVEGASAARFGVCELTGRPIARARLEQEPWTPLSLAAATWLAERFLTLDDLLAARVAALPAASSA